MCSVDKAHIADNDWRDWGSLRKVSFILCLYPVAVRSYGLGLRPLNRWDRGFECLWGHVCSSLLFVVCCVVSGLCDELITRLEVSYRCVCVCSRNLNREAA